MEYVSVIDAFYKDGRLVSNTDDVNDLLEAGWRVKMITPMGAFGYGYGSVSMGETAGMERVVGSDHGFAALVVLEHDDDGAPGDGKG